MLTGCGFGGWRKRNVWNGKVIVQRWICEPASLSLELEIKYMTNGSQLKLYIYSSKMFSWSRNKSEILSVEVWACCRDFWLIPTNFCNEAFIFRPICDPLYWTWPFLLTAKWILFVDGEWMITAAPYYIVGTVSCHCSSTSRFFITQRFCGYKYWSKKLCWQYILRLARVLCPQLFILFWQGSNVYAFNGKDFPKTRNQGLESCWRKGSTVCMCWVFERVQTCKGIWYIDRGLDWKHYLSYYTGTELNLERWWLDSSMGRSNVNWIWQGSGILHYEQLFEYIASSEHFLLVFTVYFVFKSLFVDLDSVWFWDFFCSVNACDLERNLFYPSEWTGLWLTRLFAALLMSDRDVPNLVTNMLF